MKKTKGFSLMELVMVICVLAIFAAVAMLYLNQSLQSYQQSDQQLALTSEADLALARIKRELLQATTITVMGSQQIVFIDAFGNNINYQLSANQLLRQQDSNPAQPLVSSVSQFSIQYLTVDLTTALSQAEIYYVDVSLSLANNSKTLLLSSVIHPRLL